MAPFIDCIYNTISENENYINYYVQKELIEKVEINNDTL